MLEELFNVLKADFNNFDLQYKKDKYRLILDGAKDFTGDTVEEVLNKAVDWLDSRETNSYLNSNISFTKEMHENGIPEGFKDMLGNSSNKNFGVNYRALGYESDGRE